MPMVIVKFIRALYASSTVSVRLPNGVRSDRMPLARGVRQGDPLSSILFDIFIDSMLDPLAAPTGDVTSLRPAAVPGMEGEAGKVCGLMLADDVVLIADGLESAAAGHAHVTNLANQFHMTFGVPKCGVMIITKADSRHTELTQHLTTNPAQHTIQEQVIPIVREYEYLGIMVHDSLSLDTVIADRRAKGTRALLALRPFLCNVDIATLYPC